VTDRTALGSDRSGTAPSGAESAAAHISRHQRARFINGLGIGQIVSWGSLYYSFPLLAEPMGRGRRDARAEGLWKFPKRSA
jgi:hypothetical protein